MVEAEELKSKKEKKKKQKKRISTICSFVIILRSDFELEM